MDLRQLKADQDSARKIVETVNLHLAAHCDDIFQVINRWCAFKLETGETDGQTYESKDEAIRYQEPREREYCYLKIYPDGIKLNDAERFLKINRNPFVDVLAPEHKMNPLLHPPSATVLNPEHEQ